MSGEEWGPWLQHDGKGCPCKGSVIEARWMWPDGTEHGEAWGGDVVWVVPPDAGDDPLNSSWVWFLENGMPTCHNPENAPIVRYRIRKPRGLTILENLIADLPEPAPKAKVRA